MALDQSAPTDIEQDGYPPAFDLLCDPAMPAASGLIFASPHSGSFYPDDMKASVGIETLRLVEDAALDRMIGPAAVSAHIPMLMARYGRAYVDLNRAQSDLDPALIVDCPVRHPTAKTTAGFGVLHRMGADGQPLYDHRLGMEVVEARLARVHRPYHAALQQQMHNARKLNGQAVLVDWHSMPARATGSGGPDIILGDRFGTSCDVFWTRTLRALFEAQGWRVGLNRPYAGGYATQIWGQPTLHFHSIQVEINRRLYWDEARHAPDIGWKRCQSSLQRVIVELARIASARTLS